MHWLMAYRIHREGARIIPISALVLALLTAGGWLLHPVLGGLCLAAALVLFGLIVHFFRNPHVEPPRNDRHILSPCEGRVVVIEEVQDNLFFHGTVLQISIFMSPLNVHVNRNPIGGTVKLLRYFPGKYLMAFNPKSSQLNEQTYIAAENSQVRVVWKQIAGFMARRIRWYIREGDALEQGAEFGFIRFGSRVDVLLPPGCRVRVALGDRVSAGRSVLAEVPD